MSISKLLLIVGAMLLVSLPAAAQFGEVDGYVIGPDKKSVPNAVISFDRYDTKAHTEIKSDKRGYYHIATLPTGDYAITVTVDGQIRDRRDYVHISPGRQTATAGNSALGMTFTLKPAEVMQAEMKKEAAAPPADDEAAKKREAQERARKELMDSFAAGKTALDAKKYDVAIENLTKASTVDPKQAAVWSALADAYMGMARGQKSSEAGPTYDKAIAAFDKAIELQPANAGNYNNFALALAASGKMDQARANLQKAIEIDPVGAGKYHFNLGAFLMNAGKGDEAIDEFKKGIASDPKYAESYFYLGSTLAGKSTMDASGKMVPPAGTIEALQKYLELKPDGPNAQPAKDLIAALGSKVDTKFSDPKGKSKK
jgi:tetratricopeptide (TPR) repeat protein